MGKNLFVHIKVFVLSVFLLFVSSFLLHAQKKDFTTWTNLGLEYKLRSAFAVSAALEWRTKDDFGKTDRWGLQVGGSYKPLSFLKLGAGYETHYRNRGTDGWKFRHRYHVDGTLSARVQRVKLSLRERFQHTFDGYEDEFRMRSCAKVAYDIPKCKLEPYASVEMYNGLNRTEHFGVKRMRYRGGITLPLSERWEADLFYCRQWEQDKRKNIVGVECAYSF